MFFNPLLVKAAQSTAVDLTGVVATTVTSAAGLVIAPAKSEIEYGSLVANISALITTSALVLKTRWEVSNNGSTWLPLYGPNCAAFVAVAATGSGSPVTTAYQQAFPGNPSYPYIRLAMVNTGADGSASPGDDVVTVSYNWRKRIAS